MYYVYEEKKIEELHGMKNEYWIRGGNYTLILYIAAAVRHAHL